VVSFAVMLSSVMIAVGWVGLGARPGGHMNPDDAYEIANPLKKGTHFGFKGRCVIAICLRRFFYSIRQRAAGVTLFRVQRGP